MIISILPILSRFLHYLDKCIRDFSDISLDPFKFNSIKFSGNLVCSICSSLTAENSKSKAFKFFPKYLHILLIKCSRIIYYIFICILDTCPKSLWLILVICPYSRASVIILLNLLQVIKSLMNNVSD